MTNEQVVYWQKVLMNYFNVERWAVHAWYSTPPVMRVWIKGATMFDPTTIDIPFDELAKYERTP